MANDDWRWEKSEQRFISSYEQAQRRLAMRINKNFVRLDIRDLDASWPAYIEAVNTAGVRLEYEVTTRDALLYLIEILAQSGHALRKQPVIKPFDMGHLTSLLRLTGPIFIKQLKKHGWTDQAAMLSSLRRTLLWVGGDLAREAQQSVIDAADDYNQQAILSGGTAILQGYERVAQPTACAFCKMLAGASRKHPVYNVTPKWLRPHGPVCKCTLRPVPVYRTQRTLSAREIAFNRAMYEQIKASRDRKLAEARKAVAGELRPEPAA